MPTKKPTGAPTGRPRSHQFSGAGAEEAAEMVIANANAAADAIEDKETNTIARIKGILDESAADAAYFSVAVSRVIPVPGRAERQPWIFNCTVDDLQTLRERLRDEWGAGRYRCRIARNLIPWAQYDLEIELAPRRSSGGVSGASPAAEPTAAPAVQSNDRIAALLERMAERQERSDRLLEALLTRAATPTPASSAFGGVKEAVESLVALQALVPKPDPNIGLGLFEKGFALAKELIGKGAGAGAGETESGGLLDKVLEALQSPAVTAIAQNLTNRQPAAAPATRREPLPIRTPAPAIAPAAAPASAAGSGLSPALGEAIDFLCAKAAEGADPALFVDWCVDSLEAVPGAFEYLESQTYKLGALEAAFPQIGQHRPWFARLIENLMTPADSEPLPGQPADGGDNGVRLQ